MKKTKIIYWIFTGLFSALMIFSSIGGLIGSPQAVQVMTLMGYPPYLAGFIGVAKILGAIAILIPGYPRLKEWAYAGLMTDLAGAAYSQMASHFPPSGLAFIAVFVVIGFVSYIYYHKKKKEEGKPTV